MSDSRPLDHARYDLRLAIRALGQGRVSSLVLVLSLAVGIGLNVALFTVVHALLLRPLPVRDAAGLYGVTLGNFASYGWVERDGTMNHALWRELRDSRDVFSEVFAYAPTLFDISSGGETRLVPGAFSSAAMWSTLGVPPLVGRTLGPDDERRGSASAVAVIGETLWETEFGRDPGILGHSLRIGGRPFAIVGVVPRRFTGLYVGTRAEIYVTLEASDWLTSGDQVRAFDAQHWWLVAAGRLRHGVSAEAAGQRLAAMSAAAMDRTIPAEFRSDPRIRDAYLRQRFELATLSRGFSYERDRLATPLLVASGLMAALLLLACANVATLQLGRGLARTREFAIRLAVGASARQIAWQVLLENLLLGGTGAALGLLVAAPATRLLSSLYDTRFDSLQLDLRPDGTVLACAAGLGLVAALSFGLAPAIQAMRTDASGTLTSARGTGAVEPVRFWLLAVQVSLAVALGSSALLFGATLSRLTSGDQGFTARGVVLLDVATDRSSNQAASSSEDRARSRAALVKGLLERFSALPAVESAAASYVTPLSGSTWQSNITIGEGPDRLAAHVYWHVITPAFFETYRTPILAGRSIRRSDTLGSPQVVLVNRAFVDRVLRGKPYASRRIHGDLGEAMRVDAEIVGVATDVKYQGLRADAPPTVYVAMAQDPRPPDQISVALRARGPVTDLLSAIRTEMRVAEPGLTYMVRPFEQQVADASVGERAMATMSGLFGILAVVLAALGIYGLASYSVRQRQAEIGIRLALGATVGRILGTLLARPARAAATGMLAGVALAYWAARAADTLLYEVTAGSVTVYLAALGILAIVGTLAVIAPARRAVRIDPAQTLRME